MSGKYVVGRDKYLAKYAEKYCMPIYRFPTDRMIHFYGPVIDRNIRLREELKSEFDAAWGSRQGSRIMCWASTYGDGYEK